jgi:tripartite-type tricarboxylate transporter receptor subunit TctC
VARINAAVRTAMHAPETTERLRQLAVTPDVQPADAWEAYRAAESAKWGAVIRARNIRVE